MTEVSRHKKLVRSILSRSCAKVGRSTVPRSIARGRIGGKSSSDQQLDRFN